MQPWPPCAMKPSAVASSPESWLKSSPMAARCCETRTTLAVASFTPAMFFKLEQALHGVDRHVDHRAGRDVVDDDRDADGVVDRLEVLVEPFLGRLVVVGRDDQHGVGAGLLGVLGDSSIASRVELEPGARDHRHPALGLLDAPLDHAACARRATASGFRRWCRPARGRWCPRRSANRPGREMPSRRARRC